MSAIKLVLADVDGTLVTEQKVLTERTVQAVRRLQAAGIKFAITSGRPPRGMAMLVEPLALDGVIAGFNGGVFANPDQSIVEQRLIASDAAREALRIIGVHGMDAWVYTAQEWLVQDAARPHVAREQWTVKFAPEIVPSFDVALDRAVKIVGVSDDRERMQTCEQAAQQALGTRVSAARSQPYYLDITNPEANKGAVVAFLSQKYGIERKHVATIGDMPNDVMMFENSGMSIAMGNASAEVQARATHVTSSFNDEGFAAAMERFVLGSAP